MGKKGTVKFVGHSENCVFYPKGEGKPVKDCVQGSDGIKLVL